MRRTWLGRAAGTAVSGIVRAAGAACLAVVLASGAPVPAVAAGIAGKAELAAALSREFGGDWQAEVWGRTVWAKGVVAETAAIAGRDEALARGAAIVARIAPILGLRKDELGPEGAGETDCQFGVGYRQALGGVPVEGGRMDINFLKRTGGEVSITGTLYPGIAVPTTPAFPPEDAGRAAWVDYRENWRRHTTTYTSWEQIPAEQKVLRDSRLVIVPGAAPGDAARLAWRLSYGSVAYRVDAMTGSIIDAVPETPEGK